MKNLYEINGDTTVIYLDRKDGSLLECTIDTEDLPKVSVGYKWTAHCTNNNVYAVTYKGHKLHRVILDHIGKEPVDHIDGNGLHNKKCNLRVSSFSNNSRNRKGATKSNKSGIRGVGWDKATNRWRATIWVDNRNIHLGYYEDKYEAGRVANKARIDYFGSQYANRVPIRL